ncbi:hypothetical protein SDC9_63112 [bioreactor metagenome]|uniref:Uncharacterized protein n=1 Tax=bioreactor metagenome TaxID=1076179 RepID=A0A644XLP5_9ZZZZ
MLLVTGSVVGFIHDSVLLEYYMHGRRFCSQIMSSQIDSSQIPAQLKTKIGDSLIIAVNNDCSLLHKPLLPSFIEQIESLQLHRLDSITAIIRFSTTTGSVVELAPNLFGYIYNLSSLSIGQSIQFGVTKLDVVSEKIVGVLETVLHRVPLKTTFPFVYKPEVVREFAKQLKIAA